MLIAEKKTLQAPLQTARELEFSEKEIKLTFLFLSHQQIVWRYTEEEKHPWSGKGGIEWGMPRIVCC